MQQVTTLSTADHPRLSWGAIFAGWFVALGMAGLLTLGGLALGLSAYSSNPHSVSGSTIGTGVAVWMVLVWIGALFVGGMFASWFDGKDDNTMGTMHGITVWALFASTSGLMLAFGGGQVMSPHAMSWQTSAQIAGANPEALERLDRQTERARLDMASEAPATTVDAGSPQQNAESMETRAAHRLAVVAGMMFLASILGLLAAALGGWLGAHHVHRVYHLRRYARSPLNS